MWNARLRPLFCYLRLNAYHLLIVTVSGKILLAIWSCRLLRMLICTKDVVERYTDHVCHELSTSHDARSAIKEPLISGKPCNAAVLCRALRRAEWACYLMCSEAVG
jgi:hypothetical protein